jgi:hypothetical protein
VAIVILVMVLALALWRAHRTRSSQSTWPLQLVRYGAVAFNVVSAFLHLNLEVTSRFYGLPNESSLWIRAQEVAPLLALVVLLWSPRGGSSSVRLETSRI